MIYENQGLRLLLIINPLRIFKLTQISHIVKVGNNNFMKELRIIKPC